MSVKPKHYDITLTTNFNTEETDFTFDGKTLIQLESDKPVKQIILNAADLIINTCYLVGDKQTALTWKQDENAEELIVDFPEAVKGSFSVAFDYVGKIKDNMKGLYQTTYSVGSDKHTGAITQFETEDARRMFPCFDEPGMKATFIVNIVTDEKFTVISNTPVASEKVIDGKRHVTFEKTPVMSTYLLMVGIADFEFSNGKLRDIDVRVITHPGKIQYGEMALDFGKKTLDYCQKYFDIPYPLPKMDLIATPDFAAGAMENWGAITFRETALLKFPGVTTKTQENRILSVIAHEMTHQWFGDLVSPIEWKYIWLNESFANFFGHKIVDDYYPELHFWDEVIGGQTNIALTADSYHETVPIEIAGQKKTSYNVKSIPIIYNKGGAMLRMIEDFIGHDKFQKGLQIYLKNHAYDVASSNHLWEALEEASKMPITKLMENWVLQTGFPIINVSRGKGNTLTFKQERFTFIENNDQKTWIIPMTIAVYTDKDEKVIKKYLLDAKEGTFDIGFPFKSFKLNDNHTGFYRVNYKPEDLANLGTLVKEGKLSTLDSFNIINDLFALLKAKKVSLETYLNFIPNFNSEKIHTAIKTISDQLVELQFLTEGKNKERIESEGIKFHETMFEKINYEPQATESHLTSILRNTLLMNAGYLGSKKAITFGLKQFKAYKEGKKVQPDILEAVLTIGARETNDLKWFLDKYDNANNEAELVLLGNIFGEFTDEKAIDTVLNEVVFSKIHQRNISFLMMRLCSNPNVIPKMWKFYIANLDNFGGLHQSMQGRCINLIVSNSVNKDTKKDMEGFFASYNKTNEVAKITTEKAFESQNINLQVKKYLSN